jgi:peptidoglycan/xylan/chitin deacetylase (PgdA/CDA1 family)
VTGLLLRAPGRATAFASGFTAGAVMAGGVAAAAYASPSIARLLPPRLRLTPRLSGIGRPDHLALTFDDGPDPTSTPAVMAALERLGWSATFFCLGPMVEAAPALAAELVAAGHEVGVHGYAHDGAIRRSPTALRDDVVRARDLIGAATGVAPAWYRPPYGELSLGSLHAARAAAVRLVLWSAWGRDWRAEATPATVVRDLRRGVLAGGTALLHDSDCTSAPGSWHMTVGALPLLAEYLDGVGLSVGPLGEHGLLPAPTLPV